MNPQFYAFRWITLLLTQEFPFPDTVRLWDTILASRTGRQPCLLRLCTAMLLHQRAQLLQVCPESHNLPLGPHGILALHGDVDHGHCILVGRQWTVDSECQASNPLSKQGTIF